MSAGTDGAAAAEPAPMSQSQADYEQRMDELFAPIKREVERLRTALADAENFTEDDL